MWIWRQSSEHLASDDRNCGGFGRCQLLPGIAMSGRFEFVDEGGSARQLVGLQIEEDNKSHRLVPQRACAVIRLHPGPAFLPVEPFERQLKQTIVFSRALWY
jgi:hypothetical protein